MADAALTPAQLAAALRAMEDGRMWTQELRRGYRRVGTRAAGWARDEMRRHSLRQVQRAASGVRGSSTSTSARVSVASMVNTSSGRRPMGLAAVWGTKGPTGWYAGYFRPPWARGSGASAIDPVRRRGYSAVAATRPNNPRHVGNSWQVGRRGEGPRGLNDALADNEVELVDMFAAEAESIMAKALRVGGR